jgi:hypothetical protein
MQVMTRSYDTTNTSSKMETLPLWCVEFKHDRDGGVHTRFTDQTVSRLMAHYTVSTNISFLGTLFTSPLDLTNSASVTTKP